MEVRWYKTNLTMEQGVEEESHECRILFGIFLILLFITYVTFLVGGMVTLGVMEERNRQRSGQNASWN